MTRLLLVEDDEAVRITLCEGIELEGYAVDSVESCAEALAALGRERYAVLVTDARLPDGSGRDLARQAIAAGAKVVLLSGHPDELRDMPPGAVIGVAKPFRLGELMDAIARQIQPE